MALTKKFLKALGLNDDQIEQIFDGHEDSINAQKEKITALQAELDTAKAENKRLATVEKDLVKANHRIEDLENADETLKKVRKEFDDYKADISAKNVSANKRAAYKKLLTAAGIPEKRHEAILKLKGFEGIELDDDGNVKNADELTKSIGTEWSDFVVTEKKTGADTPNPPSNTGGKTTKEQIMAITDDIARQTAIAQNHELFGF